MLKLTHPTIDIAIVCSDFAKSLHFYRDCLGLEIAADLEIPADVARGAGLAPRAFRHVRLRAGDTLIKLMQIEDPPAAGSTEFKAGVRWLTFFVAGLETGLFPFGESLAHAFARKGSVPALLAFAFALGFATSRWPVWRRRWAGCADAGKRFAVRRSTNAGAAGFPLTPRPTHDPPLTGVKDLALTTPHTDI